MKFSTVIVAAAALVCSSVHAALPSEVGEVKGVPLKFEAPASLRSAQFIKGDAIIHSRSEDLATSKIAVPDAANPYKSTGTIGVAYSATNESDAKSSSSSSSAWTTPLAVGGCAVAAVGIAGFVFMKKRKQAAAAAEEESDAETPATGSPSNDRVDFNNEMETPVAV